MRNRIAIAVALAAGSFNLAVFAADPVGPNDTNGTNMTAPGVSANNQTGANNATADNNSRIASDLTPSDKKDIQDVLSKTVEATVSKGDFDNVISNLSKADRERIGSASSQNATVLDGRIDQFRKDWQAKYGQEFKLSDKQSVVFVDQNFSITRGGMAGSASDSARTAGERIAPTDSMNGTNGTNPNNGNAGSAADNSRPVEPGPKDVQANRTNGVIEQKQSPNTATPNTANNPNGVAANTSNDLGMGQNSSTQTACVDVPAQPGATACKLNLVKEGALLSSWRINIPDNIDAQRLHESLLNHLTKLDEDKANWPSDVTQAYQAVSHEMLAALVDTGTTQTNIQPAAQ